MKELLVDLYLALGALLGFATEAERNDILEVANRAVSGLKSHRLVPLGSEAQAACSGTDIDKSVDGGHGCIRKFAIEVSFRSQPNASDADLARRIQCLLCPSMSRSAVPGFDSCTCVYGVRVTPEGNDLEG